jgi:hypothetical protein
VFSTTTGDGGDDIIDFANRTEQFIRLHVTQWNSQHGRLNEFEVCGAPTSAPKQNTGEVEVTEANAPEEFQLHQNYPNPFNPTTRISYAIPHAMRVTLKIYNLKGEEIRTLVDGYRNAGQLRSAMGRSAKLRPPCRFRCIFVSIERRRYF